MAYDEGITSTDMNTPLATTMNDVQGPITRARARQLNYQVNSFLGLSVSLKNSMMLHNGDDLLVLRNLGWDSKEGEGNNNGQRR